MFESSTLRVSLLFLVPGIGSVRFSFSLYDGLRPFAHDRQLSGLSLPLLAFLRNLTSSVVIVCGFPASWFAFPKRLFLFSPFQLMPHVFQFPSATPVAAPGH